MTSAKRPAEHATANLAASAALWSTLLPDGGAVFASPGSRSTPLLLAAHARSDIRLFMLIDERAAAFAALGFGRGSGSPAALLCTSGSAGAHYLPAVMEAYESEVPLLILTADRPPELQHRGAPQTTDQTKLFGSHLVHQVQLPTPRATMGGVQMYADLGRQARSHALAPGRHGPVHVNAPFAKPFWEGLSTRDAHHDEARASVPTGNGVVAATDAAHPAVATAVHADLAALLEAARVAARGVIFCGPQTQTGGTSIAREAVSNHVLKLARVLGWPVIVDPLAALANSDDPWVLRHADSFCRIEAVADLSPDVVIHLGQLPVSQPLNHWLARATATFHLGGADRHYNAPERHPTRVQGDPVQLLGHVLAQIGASSAHAPSLAATTHGESSYAARLKALDGAAALASQSVLALNGGWSEIAITKAVVGNACGTLLVGNSTPVRDLDRFGGHFAPTLRVVCNRGVNGIDGTLATALGLAVATSTRVTVLLGDLAFLHDLDGLQALSRTSLPVTVVRIDNGGGGIFDFLPISQHETAFETLYTTARPFDLSALCQAFGIAHRAVTDSQGLEIALLAAQKAPGVHVVDARVDRKADRRVRAEVERQLCSAITRARHLAPTTVMTDERREPYAGSASP